RPDLEYRVDAEADGFAPSGTEWVKPGDRKFETFAALVVQPTTPIRTVAGRVVDARGRPVVGVLVFQSGDGPGRTRATSGPDGWFRLPGVYSEPAFLFVEGDGLAFEGHRIEAGDEAVELKVRREGEPAGPALRTLAPLLSREQERAQGRRLLGNDVSL